MTTLANRTNTALVVIDVQTGVVDTAYRRDETVGVIAGLVDRARQADVPVIWVRHASEDLTEDTEAWQIVPELAPDASEPVIDKRYGDAFEQTDFEQVLARGAVGRLIVTGAQTDACIRATLHGALVRGYDALLVADAHTTDDLTAYGAPPPQQVIAHTNLYWTYEEAPGRTAGTLQSAEVAFG